ncbi:hypothetical protein [Gemmata massiliana]|uniref:hypothetical protein n=1 Tax=Gemmata massiliana TaxID=1210884 RepID=UPI0013A6B664|nr:hypothetical protein [Gemmata massiliana]
MKFPFLQFRPEGHSQGLHSDECKGDRAASAATNTMGFWFQYRFGKYDKNRLILIFFAPEFAVSTVRENGI